LPTKTNGCGEGLSSKQRIRQYISAATRDMVITSGKLENCSLEFPWQL
jgi:hypothetical protein